MQCTRGDCEVCTSTLTRIQQGTSPSRSRWTAKRYAGHHDDTETHLGYIPYMLSRSLPLGHLPRPLLPPAALALMAL